MNLFARTLGGVFGDKFGERWGLSGRVRWLFMVLFCEGLALMLFSRMNVLALGHSDSDSVQPVRADERRRDVFGGAVHQQKGVGFGGGHCRGGRQCRGGGGGVSVQVQCDRLADGAVDPGRLVTCCSFLTFAVNFNEAAETEAKAATEARATPKRRQELEPGRGVAA